MPIIAPPNPESRQIGDYMTDLELRMKRVEQGLSQVQLGNSSLEGSGINMFDATGNYRGTVGFQQDGTTTVTSQNPQPPPIPAAPTIKQDIACLVVSHDGSTASGQGNPADFSHLNVYTADAGIPGVRTLRGTINPVPGSYVVSGLDYTNYLVDVTAVNQGGKESDHSAVASGTPQMVVSADIIAGAVTSLHLAADSVTSAAIQANAVTTTEIADNSISSPKVIAGSIIAGKLAVDSVQTGNIVSQAVTASKILALTITSNEIAANAITAGKITAGSITASKLEANMIIATRIIAGTDTGARVEMHPTAGIQAFNSSGTRTFWIDATTGSFTATGSMSTAFSGTRIQINPSGTNPDEIRFFPSATGRWGAIDAITSGTGGAGIRMYGADDSGSSYRGICIAREDFASLIYADPFAANMYSTIRSDIFANSDHTHCLARYVDHMADANQGSDAHVGLMMSNGSSIQTNTLLYFWSTKLNGGEPWFSAPYKDSGLSFAASPGTGLNARVYVVGNTPTNRRDIYPYSIIYDGDIVKASSQQMKRNIQPAQDLDPRQAVRNAKAKYFQVNHHDEGGIYDPDGNMIQEPRSAPVQLGFIAEELPDELTTMVYDVLPGENYLGINKDRMLTMVWQGQGDVQDKLDSLANGPKWIPELSAPPPAPTTGATLYVYAGSLYAVFATGKISKVA